MRRTFLFLVISAAACSQACSSSSDNSNPDDSSVDSTTGDTGAPDTTRPDTTITDTGSSTDSAKADTTPDSIASDTSDAGSDAADADDGACPLSWTEAPDADPSLYPDGGDAGGVLMHASGVGTQDYTCTATATEAGTTYAWVFVGPEAELDDCHTVKVGDHFASDAGPTRPEWKTLDGTYVVGKKVSQFVPDAGPDADSGPPSVPWLLLQTDSTGGTGVLSHVNYIHRLYTAGGVAPSTPCTSSNVGTTEKVHYTAEYYFYGP